MEPLANFEGRLVPLSEVRIPATDRGFLFGDAIYEVLRVYNNRPWLEQEHWDRLARSLKEIHIAGVDLADLRRRMAQTLTAANFGEAMVYIQITRGSAPRTHAFPKSAKPLELLWVQRYDDGPTAALREIGSSVVTHPDLRWQRCDVKSTNLLANVLACQVAAEKNAREAILYLPDGTLSEASHSTFFWVKDGVVKTTPIKANILPGITRQFVIRLCQKNDIPFREETLKMSELFGVDEFFLSGTTAEVLSVVTADGRSLGGGTPGAITRRLQHLHDAAIREFLSR